MRELLGIALLATCVAVAHAPVTLAAPSSPREGVQVTPNWSVEGALSERSASELDAEIDSVARMGGDLIRLHVDWAELAPDSAGADHTYLARLDRALARAEGNGLAVILNIIGTPCWAVADGPQCPQTRESHMAAPRPEAFAAVTRQLLVRYPDLHGYEVWNEPNCCGFWRGSAAQFAQIVNAAGKAKPRGSSTRIIAGGFYADGTWMLPRLYEVGMRGHDAISIHPYSLTVNPYQADSPFRLYIERARKVMLAHGDRSPVYLTEFGHATCPAHIVWIGSAREMFCVSDQQQAQWLVASFRAAAEYPYVRGVTAFSMRDVALPSDPFPFWVMRMGILDYDLSPKPAYWALRRQLLRSRGDLRKKGCKRIKSKEKRRACHRKKKASKKKARKNR